MHASMSMFMHIAKYISATLLPCKRHSSNQKNNTYHIYLKLTAVSAIDTSGISLFKELKATLEKKGVEVRMLNSEVYLICSHTLIGGLIHVSCDSWCW